MYEKKRGGEEPKKEDRPKFKGSKKFYLSAGIAFVLVIGGLLTFYFVYKSGIAVDTEVVDLSSCAKTLNSYKDGKLSVILCVKEDGTLAIFWQNLPKDTKTLNIYRRDQESGDSVLWKTVEVTGESGSLDLGREEGGSATYTVEGVSASGSTAWSSVGNTTSAGTTGSQSSSGQISTSSSQTSNPGQQNQTTIPPPATTPPVTPPPATTLPPSTPPPASSTPPPSEPVDISTIIYYTPSGQISGTSSVSIASFWVQHVNKKIEIGWQNIPTSTTKIIIYRSQSQSSGYVKLLEQTDLLTSYMIRLEDNAVNEDYYYKMEAKNGLTLIATYGPVFLLGL